MCCIPVNNKPTNTTKECKWEQIRFWGADTLETINAFSQSMYAVSNVENTNGMCLIQGYKNY